MRVRCIKDYHDLELDKAVKVGDVFEVAAARGEALTTANNKAGCPLCEEVVTPTAEKEAEAEPVKKGRKKKEA